MTQTAIHYGKEQINYSVVKVPHRNSKIHIHVHPNGSVQVDAPEHASQQTIKQAVYKRARWIHNNLEKIKEQQQFVQTRQYVSGESHFYLGRRYPLKIQSVKKQDPEVKLYRGRLHIKTKDRDPAAIRYLLNQWYRQRALQMFEKRLQVLIPSVVWLKGQVSPMKLLDMKKQWGSCSPKGTIILNPHLVKAPRECIDYVICHELCHLKEHNHSPKYYRLLSQLMPEWELVKGKLDGMAELLLNH